MAHTYPIYGQHTGRRIGTGYSRKELDKLGVPKDMTAQDVMDFFSLPDDDDSMHSQKRSDGQGPSK